MIRLMRLEIFRLLCKLRKGLREAGIAMHPCLHSVTGLVYFSVFNFFFYV